MDALAAHFKQFIQFCYFNKLISTWIINFSTSHFKDAWNRLKEGILSFMLLLDTFIIIYAQHLSLPSCGQAKSIDFVQRQKKYELLGTQLFKRTNSEIWT